MICWDTVAQVFANWLSHGSHWRSYEGGETGVVQQRSLCLARAPDHPPCGSSNQRPRSLCCPAHYHKGTQHDDSARGHCTGSSGGTVLIASVITETNMPSAICGAVCDPLLGCQAIYTSIGPLLFFRSALFGLRRYAAAARKATEHELQWEVAHEPHFPAGHAGRWQTACDTYNMPEDGEQRAIRTYKVVSNPSP